jgi:hypothetical protein
MTEHEIDARIAMKVMGTKDVQRVVETTRCVGLIENVLQPLPLYSTDIRFALEVMTKNHEWVDLRYDRDGWTCYLKCPRTEGFTGTQGSGPTAALAICHAALNAVHPPIEGITR